MGFRASAIMVSLGPWKERMSLMRALPISVTILLAVLTGRCTYSIEDGGYDLSRFRQDAGLTSAPDELRGLVATNGEAVRAILSQERGRDLRFVVIGDTVSDKNRTFKDFLGEIADLDPRPSFIIHLGDRVVRPVVRSYGAYLKAIQDPPCPILHVDGNHDIREEGERISRAFFGDRDFSFDVGAMRFIFMDDNPEHGRRGGEPGFSREQLDWLEAKLEDPRPARKFFFAHVPPRAPFKKLSRGLAAHFAPRLKNEEEFLGLLARHKVVMAAFGHRHVHASSVYNGVLMVITGGGGQRNFLEPSVNEPRFSKKKHYTLVDIPAASPFGAFEGILSCVAKGYETLSVSTFAQPSLVAGARDGPVVLRPYQASPAWPFGPGLDPAHVQLGFSSRTP
jgi:hypothetical protein